MNKRKTNTTKIISVQGTQDGFFIAYKSGEQKWIEYQHYSHELYKNLAMEGFVP